MKDIILLMVSIALWWGVAKFFITRFRKKGYKTWLSRLGGIAGGFVVSTIFLMIVLPSPDEPSAEVSPQPAPAPAPKSEIPSPTSTNSLPQKKPALNIEQSRALAKESLKVIEQAEKALSDGVQVGDFEGIKRYVSLPLANKLKSWSDAMTSSKGDRSGYFVGCNEAMIELQLLADGATLTRSVANLQYLRSKEDRFYSQKERCINEIKKTNSAIKKEIADDEASLNARGGDKCLTVYGVDDKGNVITQPKPQDCPK